jgi:hypothetical protein
MRQCAVLLTPTLVSAVLHGGVHHQHAVMLIRTRTQRVCLCGACFLYGPMPYKPVHETSGR